MGESAWPEREVFPLEESLLLQEARLRPFGVNYLQGAICPDLGLLAHVDGSSVLLLPFTLDSPDGGPPQSPPLSPPEACLARIDLQAGRKKIAAPGGGSGGSSGGGGGSRSDCNSRGALDNASPVVARGLSWSRCCRRPSSATRGGGVSSPVKGGVSPSVKATAEENSSENSRGGSYRGRGGFLSAEGGKLGGCDRGDGDDGGDGGDGGDGDDGGDSSVLFSGRGEKEEVGVEGEVNEVVCHLAVACGSEVRLWQVSKLRRFGGGAVGLEGGRGGREGDREEKQGGKSVGKKNPYRIVTAEVLTNWNRHTTGGGGDGDADADGKQKDGTEVTSSGGILIDKSSYSGNTNAAASLQGDGGKTRGGIEGGRSGDRPIISLAENIRCVSFKPVWGGSGSRLAASKSEQGAVPLAAWCDTGATVFGPGSDQTVNLPPPVIKKRARACGAWSGCGRRLAVSSGGEIRVYNDPWGSSPVVIDGCGGDAGSPLGDVRAGAQRPTTGRGGYSDDVTVSGTAGEEKNAPIAGKEFRERKSSAVPQRRSDEKKDLGDNLEETKVLKSSFHTALCAEAALQGGGSLFYSPGSSQCGSLSPSPRTAQSPESPPPPSPRNGTHGIKSRAAPLLSSLGGVHSISTSRAQKIAARGDSRGCSSNRTTKAATSRVLVGDMLAMCPASPLAFFGTTDGGLGLMDSLVGNGGGVFSTTGSGGGGDSVGDGGGRGREDLLEAVVNDSEMRAMASEAVEIVLSASHRATRRSTCNNNNGGDGESEKVTTRRGGFRNVLPGESWLAGSLRPRSKKSRAELASPPPPNISIVGAAVPPETVENMSKPASPSLGGDTCMFSGLPQSSSVAAPEVLDLRGKIGGGYSGGGTAGSESTSGIAATHPLFRLSLGDGGFGTEDMPSTRGGVLKPKVVDENLNGSSGGFSFGGAFSGAPAGGSADRRAWLVRVMCTSNSSSSSSGDNTGSTMSGAGTGGEGSGVDVKAVAPLPPALASPDLLASSEDGRYVAVGSHACGSVACYRLSTRLVAAATTATTKRLYSPVSGIAQTLTDEGNSSSRVYEGAAMAGSTYNSGSTGGGVGGQESCDSSGSVLREAARGKKRQRRAIPLCTLRLPPGFRAKGVAFVRRGDGGGSTRKKIDVFCRQQHHREAAVDEESGEGCGDSQIFGGARLASGDDSGEGVSVLVLAACPVATADVVKPASARSTPGGGPASAASFRRSSSSNSIAEGSPFRTVLLRYCLSKERAAAEARRGLDIERGRMQSPPSSAGLNSENAVGESDRRARDDRNCRVRVSTVSSLPEEGDRRSWTPAAPRERARSSSPRGYVESVGEVEIGCQFRELNGPRCLAAGSDAVSEGLGFVVRGEGTTKGTSRAVTVPSVNAVEGDCGPVRRERAAVSPFQVENQYGGVGAGEEKGLLRGLGDGRSPLWEEERLAMGSDCSTSNDGTGEVRRSGEKKTPCSGVAPRMAPRVRVSAAATARKNAWSGGKEGGGGGGGDASPAIDGSGSVSEMVMGQGDHPVESSDSRTRGKGFQSDQAFLLEALEGIERRIGGRLDGMERMLVGLCDRVESLERASNAVKEGVVAAASRGGARDPRGLDGKNVF